MRTLFIFIFLLLLSVCGLSQELPPLLNYEPSEYGAGNQNWMISESDDHLIYIANNKGLLEYDGAQWQLYKTPNESIMRSVKVVGNRIYTGCYMDFGFWIKDHTGNLQYTSLVENSDFSVKEDEQFWNIIVKNDYVLFQSLSGIYSYQVQSGEITQIVNHSEINKFFQVGDSYYYQVLGDGLYQLINKEAQLMGSTAFFKSMPIILMFEHNSETYFITQDAAIYKYLNGTAIKISNSKLDQKLTVYSAALLSDKSLLLGTIANGVVSINLDGSVNYTINQGDGLINNTCLNIYEDSMGNVWLGSDNGISTVNVDSPYRIYSDRYGKLGTVYATYQSDDVLYIGTNQGLFFKRNGSSLIEFVNGTEGQAWSINKLNGTVFCNHHAGVFVLNDGIAQRVDHTIGTWEMHALENRDDVVLAGTYKGLYVLIKENGIWRLRNKISGFDISSKDVVVTRDFVYVNHEYKGVFELSLDDALTQVQENRKIEELGKGIGSDIIEFKNNLFFAKRNDIYVKTADRKNFVRDEELSKLVTGTSYTSGTFIKNDGYLWLFNTNDILKINIEDIDGSYNVEHISLSHEQRKEKIGYENLTTLGPDKYLLGNSYGYVTLNDNDNVQNSHSVTISSFNSINKGISSKISLEESTALPYENNHLRIDYASSSYKLLHTIKYQYRLIGLTDEWSPWSDKNYLEFKNLSYGDYTFEVRAQLNSTFSTNTDAVSFTILRPYYLTNLAIVLYVLLLVIIVLLLNGFYIWYFKRQKREALQNQQKELELKNLTNEKNLVELRNAKLRSDIEHRNKELAISTMAMIKKNETLNELKEELDNLPKTDESKSLKKMLDKNLNSKQDWLTFEEAFNNADKDFFKKIKELHPSLTSGDLRLCVYLRLNLSSKEIAPLLNISPRSVEIKRYRLRKKLELSREASLTSYIVEI